MSLDLKFEPQIIKEDDIPEHKTEDVEGWEKSMNKKAKVKLFINTCFIDNEALVEMRKDVANPISIILQELAWKTLGAVTENYYLGARSMGLFKDSNAEQEGKKGVLFGVYYAGWEHFKRNLK